MTRAEAKRRVCRAAAMILDSGSEDSWLWAYEVALDGERTGSLPPADARRMIEARDELLDELRRRGAEQPDEETPQGLAR